VFQDFRFGLKLLWKEKAFTITALLTLALCIGANTAIFTVLHAVILNPLPFPEPDRVVTLYNIYPGAGNTDRGSNSVPDYFDRRQMTDVFDSVAATNSAGFDVGAEGTPVRMEGQTVTPSYFRVLRAPAMLGRTFTEDEAVFQKDKFAVLSYGLWKDMFGRDAAVLGKEIRLTGIPYRIVGVMPEGFSDPGSEARIWVPLTFAPRQTTDDARHNNNWGMIARLKPGVTLTRARERIDALNKFQIERSGKLRKLLEAARFGTMVLGLKDLMVRDVRPTLYLLQAAVAFVLLIGCVNVANLMLVRSNIRMKELAIRFSLGAGRWRLGAQLLTESVTLAALGGLFGILTGYAGVRLLSYLGTKDLPRGAAIQMDSGALIFSAAVAILTGLVFGSVPVYHLFRRDLNAVFRSNERTGTTEKRALWTRSALVVCQVSLAFVLLIGAGLLTLSFVRLLSVNPGFQAQHVQTAQFGLPRSRYADDARVRNFIGGLLDTLRSTPGAAHVGAASLLPFSGNNNNAVITVVGYNLAPGELPPVPGWNRVNGGYFPAMGIPLLQGRTFTEGDGADAPKVAVIDQFLAKKYWPKGNALGAQVRQGLSPKDSVFTIVGIVGNVKGGDLAEQNPIGEIYFDYRQDVPRTMHLVVKSAVKSANDDPRVTAAIRSALLGADSELPLFDVKTMPERVSSSMRQRRAAMVICLVFAALALTLSAIGIYGVLAYTVTQRTREFGIRMALGAAAGDVVGMVIFQGVKLAAIGLAIGVAGAIALTRLMSSLLYDVKPTDPGVFLLVAGALMAVAFVASLIPSVRALRIPPATALRYE
jgi:predicted permease